MKIGLVLGEVALDRGLTGAEDCRFLRVDCGGDVVTALDLVEARAGEWVLLSIGSSASRFCPEVPADAAAVGVLRPGKNS